MFWTSKSNRNSTARRTSVDAKEKAIRELKLAFPSIRRPNNNDDQFDLRFMADGQFSSLRIIIPGEFPNSRPVMQVAGPVQHPWLDPFKQVQASPKLLNWSSSSSLVEAVEETMSALSCGTNSRPDGNGINSSPQQAMRTVSYGAMPPQCAGGSVYSGYSDSSGGGYPAAGSYQSYSSMNHMANQPAHSVSSSSGSNSGGTAGTSNLAHQLANGAGGAMGNSGNVTYGQHQMYQNIISGGSGASMMYNAPMTGPTTFNNSSGGKGSYTSLIYGSESSHSQQSDSGRYAFSHSSNSGPGPGAGAGAGGGVDSAGMGTGGTIDYLNLSNPNSLKAGNPDSGGGHPNGKLSAAEEAAAAAAAAAAAMSPIRMPDIPKSFPDLENLTDIQLERMLKDNVAFEAKLESIESVKSMRSLLEQMRDTNEENARKNLILGEEAAQLENRAKGLQAELKTMVDTYHAKVQEQAVLHTVTEESIIRELRAVKNEVDNSSEEIGRSLVDGDLPLTEFLDSYYKARMRYHSLDAKAQAAKLAL